jgi:membrane protein required for colicin V production
VTAFDVAVLVVLAFSTLFAFVRGLIRELIALIAWVFGILAAITFTPTVSAWLPEVIATPALRYLIAFTIILIAALLVGAIIAWPLAKAVRAAGLGFVDRFLGSIFGLARGLIIVVAFVLLAGLTDLPRASWWQDSVLAPPLVAAALVVGSHLPTAWTAMLDYSRTGRRPAAPGERKA